MSWQEECIKIHHHFTQETTMATDLNEQSRFFALALCGEVGELGNLFKKEWRHTPIPNFDHEVAMEIADVMMYLYLLARAEGIDIDDACNMKIEELKERWPEIWR